MLSGSRSTGGKRVLSYFRLMQEKEWWGWRRERLMVSWGNDALPVLETDRSLQ